jgi:hypothetical protein
MLELLQISKTFITNNPAIVTWGGVVVILLVGVLLQKAWIKEFLTERKLNRLLNDLGRDSMHNIIIPDGLDGNIFIEHLILMPNEILLLGVKRYRGLIFAADTIDQWTQVIGQKSYKFENPLHYLENDVLALNAYIKKSKVVSKVLFINGSEFPKGKPDNIISISDLKALQQEYSGKEIPDVLLADWKRLEELAAKNDISKGEGISLDNQNTSGLNLVALLSMFTLILFWLVWRLMYY